MKARVKETIKKAQCNLVFTADCCNKGIRAMPQPGEARLIREVTCSRDTLALFSATGLLAVPLPAITMLLTICKTMGRNITGLGMTLLLSLRPSHT